MFPHLFQREGWSFLDLSPGQSDATDGGPELQRQDSSVATDIFFTVSFILKTWRLKTELAVSMWRIFFFHLVVFLLSSFLFFFLLYTVCISWFLSKLDIILWRFLLLCAEYLYDKLHISTQPSLFLWVPRVFEGWKGRERAVISQTNNRTVSKAMLEKLRSDEAEHIFYKCGLFWVH